MNRSDIQTAKTYIIDGSIIPSQSIMNELYMSYICKYTNINKKMKIKCQVTLDASNEKTIMDNLRTFFNGRTVVIVDHRLSTVKNADQIVVLEKGEIAEIGTHRELIEKKGSYFNLVKDQLELGN